jgi:hypothetical protein
VIDSTQGGLLTRADLKDGLSLDPRGPWQDHELRGAALHAQLRGAALHALMSNHAVPADRIDVVSPTPG